MKRITILGTGFAALTAVRELRRRDRTVVITLIGPRAEFHYLPSLIWIPSGLRTPADLVVPLDRFFVRQQVTFHAGQVTDVREGGRTVVTTTGEVANDGLIIATGGRYLRKLPGIENAILPCEGIAAAEAVRQRLAAMNGGTIAFGFAANPNEPGAVRGGPMFEFLFGIDSQLRRENRRDRFKLVFFNPSKEPGQRLGTKAVKGLLADMARRGIETHLGHKLKAFTPTSVVTEGGEIPADLILFMPGMTGPAWLEGTGLPRSAGGMIQAETTCRVPGWEKVYVAGDSGSFPGPEWLPKQAHMADLQAVVAAENLLGEMDGTSPVRNFRPELMCIVDSLDKGALVLRTPKLMLMLPSSRLWHWVKVVFERRYLARYR
ncbi:MAG: FAD-dependent oxidoreductase [Alphaproteobacteria bacterium]|nr:FAD-dependent oxidoreductase [Alphaproteobacteria bacterium]